MVFKSRGRKCLGFILLWFFWMTACFGETPLDIPGMMKILGAAGACQAKKMPKELITKNAPFVKGEYDPNTFLALFPKLSLEKGQVLDFVYDYQGLGGHPVVYSRLSDKPGFASFAEFKKEYPKRYFIGDNVRFTPFYLGSIRTDDSPDGFFQLAIHVLTGEQFYLFWHAAYSLFRPVLDRKNLEDVMKGLPSDVASKAAEIDVTPRVTMSTKEVRVEYVIFGSWIGFKRLFWTISRDFPHRLIKIEENVLVPYKTPIQF